jgi:hypothetical protein
LPIVLAHPALLTPVKEGENGNDVVEISDVLDLDGAGSGVRSNPSTVDPWIWLDLHRHPPPSTSIQTTVCIEIEMAV